MKSSGPMAYATAEQATIIYKHLLLAGIDLIINVNSVGYPENFVLECNPRPGGLCRSLCIIDNTPKSVTSYGEHCMMQFVISKRISHEKN